MGFFSFSMASIASSAIIGSNRSVLWALGVAVLGWSARDWTPVIPEGWTWRRPFIVWLTSVARRGETCMTAYPGQKHHDHDGHLMALHVLSFMITFMITKFMITLWSYCCQFSTYLENHGVDMWWAKLTCSGLIQAPSRQDGLHKQWARYKAIMITCSLPHPWSWSWSSSWLVVIMCDHAWSHVMTHGCHDHEWSLIFVQSRLS